jgi:hypothetical protein
MSQRARIGWTAASITRRLLLDRFIKQIQFDAECDENVVDEKIEICPAC